MVYKNPQFIFLDEATNALDANNERAITEGLASFYMRPLHGTGGDLGLFHLRILLIFSIFMDKIVVSLFQPNKLNPLRASCKFIHRCVATAWNTRSFDRSALVLTGEVFAHYSTRSIQRLRTPQAIRLMMPWWCSRSYCFRPGMAWVITKSKNGSTTPSSSANSSSWIWGFQLQTTAPSVAFALNWPAWGLWTSSFASWISSSKSTGLAILTKGLS